MPKFRWSKEDDEKIFSVINFDAFKRGEKLTGWAEAAKLVGKERKGQQVRDRMRSLANREKEKFGKH